MCKCSVWSGNQKPYNNTGTVNKNNNDKGNQVPENLLHKRNTKNQSNKKNKDNITAKNS